MFFDGNWCVSEANTVLKGERDMHFKIQDFLHPQWGEISQAEESGLVIFAYLLVGLVILGLIGGAIYLLGKIIRSLNHYKWRKMSTRNWGRLGYVTTFSAFLAIFLFFMYGITFY